VPGVFWSNLFCVVISGGRGRNSRGRVRGAAIPVAVLGAFLRSPGRICGPWGVWAPPSPPRPLNHPPHPPQLRFSGVDLSCCACRLGYGLYFSLFGGVVLLLWGGGGAWGKKKPDQTTPRLPSGMAKWRGKCLKKKRKQDTKRTEANQAKVMKKIDSQVYTK